MKIYRAEFCYRSTEEYCLNGILGYFSTPEKLMRQSIILLKMKRTNMKRNTVKHMLIMA